MYLCLGASILIVLTSVSGFGQENVTHVSQSAGYFEVLGQGILYSVNYDYRFRSHVSFRAGFTAWSVPSGSHFDTRELIGFPLMLNYLSGKGNSHFELGLGILPTIKRDLGPNNPAILFTATLGYRFQPIDGGLVFRVGVTPVFTFDDFILPWVGLSIGVASKASNGK
jgi:hypothetical protein